ncbi:CRISPR system precrRNA processing endoribonuclease RAMP protein Cas6 [Sulfurivermis fontis]|uniref:CRISPR system precrRNA processing endoribonuclease RAMP protein Cas6 n=1 Tax=Sulfurivermis fontis TaxID=1972068 RepID=UPI000FD8D12D|nr:CRISPR system precrRNA processing endoribonuclease RAMP protein Cas6 [Sulfurivermis fontis]
MGRPSGNGYTTPVTPPVPESVTLHFLTPLRLKQGNGLVAAENLTPTTLLLAIRQRILRLGQYHSDGAGFAECHLPYLAPDSPPAYSTAMHWIDLERYSSRQQRGHKMGGLIGHIRLSLHGLETFWPALWHGQYLHVGKLTTMGLGAYRIELPQACQARASAPGFDTVAAVATRGAY